MINRNTKTILCCLRIKSAGLLIGLVDLFLNIVLLLALSTAITRPSVYDYYIKQLSKEYQDERNPSPVKYIPLENNDVVVPVSNTNFFSNNMPVFKDGKSMLF
jgi:hypothetical protein